MKGEKMEDVDKAYKRLLQAADKRVQPDTVGIS